MRLLLTAWLFSLTVSGVFAQPPAPQYGFLTERVSITNKNGIVAFPSGTRVEILDHHGSKLSVRADDKTFDVRADQVTNDAARGNALLQQDAAKPQAVQQQLSAAAAATTQPKKAQQESAAPAAPPDPHAQTKERLAQIHKEREELKIELDRVKFEQKGLPKPNSKRYAY